MQNGKRKLEIHNGNCNRRNEKWEIANGKSKQENEN